jgi:hypothetical protein
MHSNDHTILITFGLLSDDQELGDEYDEYDATDEKGSAHSQEIVFCQLTKRLNYKRNCSQIHSIPLARYIVRATVIQHFSIFVVQIIKKAVNFKKLH